MVFLKDLSLPLCYFLSTSNTCKCHQSLCLSLVFNDTNIYFEYDDLPKLVKEDKKVKSWLYCNKLALNIDKVNFLLFCSPRKKPPDLIDLEIGNKSEDLIMLNFWVLLLMSISLGNTVLVNFIKSVIEKRYFSFRLDIKFPDQLLFAFITQFSLPFLIMVLLYGL